MYQWRIHPGSVWSGRCLESVHVLSRCRASLHGVRIDEVVDREAEFRRFDTFGTSNGLDDVDVESVIRNSVDLFNDGSETVRRDSSIAVFAVPTYIVTVTSDGTIDVESNSLPPKN